MLSIRNVRAGECENSLWKTVWQSFKELNLELPHDVAIPLLGIYPRIMKASVHTKTVTHKKIFFNLKIY